MKYLGDYIHGRFVRPNQEVQGILSEDPGDLSNPVGEVLFSIKQVSLAVEAARAAFSSWSQLSFKKRVFFIRQFQSRCSKKKNELANLISREMGKPLQESIAEVDRIIAKIDISIKEEPKLVSKSQHAVGSELTGKYQFRPRGVLAILSPFNVPAYLASAQIIPALMFGNTVVLKPSEITPFVGQFLAQLWDESDLPKGVFNLIQGDGAVGARLVNHPDINGVLFTGSWNTGLKIQSVLLTQPQKLCALEMGGKNAAIVLKEANIDLAVSEIVKGAFMTTGQRCNATSRIILDQSIEKKFLPLFLSKVTALNIGYYNEKNIFMGPLASQKGFEQAQRLIAQARKEGFECLIKGGVFDHPEKRGYYLEPSVYYKKGQPDFELTEGTFTDEEILAPAVAIYTVKTPEDALVLNNRSFYGLVTSVFTRSRKQFDYFFQNAQTGIINWNVSTVTGSSRLPFGGLKRSGNDRPAGFFTPRLCTVPTASLERKSK